eukprot:CAMPEP_0198282920 /NCGR_PEP_ID=MMETSP1449-20131203/2629_1 /TAXON_ID=420275 /ORGANISM="Attheya septentrionalis, Strain CCMP2084" /LENGTH=126 /DNA_ID=CAMNT_0043979339 /DNA_START=128 /DNA_END=508 /DNA_ORIENTATION=+
MPAVKSFLMDGEAEDYRNVEVKFVSGKNAILTIFDDNVELEQVDLSKYTDKEDIHAMMVEKGFEKMEGEELEQARRELAEKTAEEDARKEALAEKKREELRKRREEKMAAARADEEERLASARDDL